MNTASLCLSLLLSGGPDMAPPSPREQNAATAWLLSQNVALPTQDQTTEALKSWRIWAATTSTAREANFALELKNISPAKTAIPIALDQREYLQLLSKSNLSRLKERITAQIPLNEPQSPSDLAQAKAMSENIAFHYLRRPNWGKIETGFNPPLPSPRELAKLGLNFAPTFYSELVGDSASVAFSIVATKAKFSPFSINSQIPQNAFRLNDELAQKFGFVLPNFQNAIAMIEFFNHWEPELIEQLLRQNRMSLPMRVRTVEDFIAYLDPTRIEQIFPMASVHDRLSLLRERLMHYVLTEPDARALLQWAFEHWLISVAQNDPTGFQWIVREFELAAGPQSIFEGRFLPNLHLPNLSVRVPVVVGPQAYTILRIENVDYNPFPDSPKPLLLPKPWDSRHLDQPP